MVNYRLEDVSVVIPTYNRAKDLKVTLNSFRKFWRRLKEIIIIDQSKNKETKNLILGLKNSKLKYIYSNIPSLTKARNIGIKNVSEESKIVCFIDDDVNVRDNYFKEILKTFKDNEKAILIGGYVRDSIKHSKIELLLRKIFFIGRKEASRADVVSVYGNNYPNQLSKRINAQWLPGVNMCIKKEVLASIKFDENFYGYCLAEDFDFSYRVYQRYPKGIIITPFARIQHRYSNVERIVNKDKIYMNQINHFYLNYKNFNKTVKEKIIFMWLLGGLIKLRVMIFLLSLNKKNWLNLKYFLGSLLYCLKNQKELKRGNLRYEKG
jgi:GT2 family glycosyltransferase